MDFKLPFNSIVGYLTDLSGIRLTLIFNRLDNPEGAKGSR